MEWLALALWALTAAVAVPTGSGAFAAPPLGLVPPLGLAGLGLSIAFAAGGGDAEGLMWVAFGVAIAGVAVTGAGAAELIGEAEYGEPQRGRAEEHAAAFSGIALPLFGVMIGISLLAALAADGAI